MQWLAQAIQQNITGCGHTPKFALSSDSFLFSKYYVILSPYIVDELSLGYIAMSLSMRQELANNCYYLGFEIMIHLANLSLWNFGKKSDQRTCNIWINMYNIDMIQVPKCAEYAYLY